MGDAIRTEHFSREDRQRYREKVGLCLEVFARMLATHAFDLSPRSAGDARDAGVRAGTDSGRPVADGPVGIGSVPDGAQPLTGLEVELNLVDDDGAPAMKNAAVLAAIADQGYQTELGAYNIELNVPPRPLGGTSMLQLEDDLRASLNEAEMRAHEVGAHIVMTGILPTVMPEHFQSGWMSDNSRYEALNDSIFAARGEDLLLNIGSPDGDERLSAYAGTVAPESACTSVQLHVQVSPESFPSAWNAAQVIAAPQIALAANSPFFFGRRLWHETRIELFQQSIDTRPPELRNQGVRPRVWFGERWITSIFDLFEENVRYFPALLPEVSDEDPVAVLESGRPPQLQELRLHNGTIYRWNRPVYDIVDGRAHLRVENRVLPAGPTVLDMIANAVFYHGLLRVLAEQDRPLWSTLSFSAAEENFHECAYRGMDARLFWPGMGQVRPDELVLRRLLPLAQEGLARWGVDGAAVDRYLGVIEGRATSGRNGARWQIDAVRALQDAGADRAGALRAMLRLYRDHMHSNEPVHTWDLPAPTP